MKRNRNNGELRDDVCGKFVFINPVSGKDGTSDVNPEANAQKITNVPPAAPTVPMAPAGPQTSSFNADKVVATLKKYWWVYLLVALYLIIKKD